MLPVDRFKDFVLQNLLFDNDDNILAAVSGGMDSVLMAHLLAACGYQFAMAHCNFRLRGKEADTDQRFCRQLAKNLKVPFHTIEFDTVAYAAQQKISIQMAARNLRYQWFQQLRQQYGYTAIALAHHQNDAIETILLNLTRGTGIAGLHGILPKNGALIRPMLYLTREEIANIAAKNNLVYTEDSSNTSAKYARNKIRLEVVPKLKELNPALEATFQQNQQRFKELEQLLEHETARHRKKFTLHDDELHIPIAAVKDLYPQALLLFNLLKDSGFNREHIVSILASLDKHSGRVFETGTHSLVLDRDKLILKSKAEKILQPVTINSEATELTYGRYRLTLLQEDGPLIVKDNPLAASVDAGLLMYPLTMRPWRKGDYFFPLGMASKQKLSDFFIHQKVPLTQKNQVPVLENGNGDIVWIVGYRPDNRYKVSDNTKKVTIFELYKLA